MIPAQLLHQLLVNIVDSTQAIHLEEGVDPSDAAYREALESLAVLHELNFEDTATLYRVAAGEATAPSPDGSVYHGIVVQSLLHGEVVKLDSGHVPAEGTRVVVFVEQAGR